MYRLVYVSTAAQWLSDEDITLILDASQNNNYERFITGLLVHNGSSFMQILEGAEDEVMDIYGRILRDPRHIGVAQILGKAGVDRIFSDWAMNYHRVELSDRAVRREGSVADMMPEATPVEVSSLFVNFASLQ